MSSQTKNPNSPPKQERELTPEELKKGMNNLYRNAIPYLMGEEPILGKLFAKIEKIEDPRTETAYVTVRKSPDGKPKFVLGFNPKYMASLSIPEQVAILIHELFHLVHDHLPRMKKITDVDWDVRNIAADLAINQYIKNLPEGALKPGHGSFKDLPEGLSFEKYLEIVKNIKQQSQQKKQQGQGQGKGGGGGGGGGQQQQQQQQQQGGGGGGGQQQQQQQQQGGGGGGGQQQQQQQQQQGGGGGGQQQGQDQQQQQGGGGGGDIDWDSIKPMDDHEPWKEANDLSPSDMQEIQKELIDVLKKGLEEAQRRGNKFGTIPEKVFRELLAALTKTENWKSILRFYAGKELGEEWESTFRRISRRMPYLVPGMKKEETQKRIVVFIDNSGSIKDEEIMKAYSEVAAIAKTNQVSEVVVYNFDTEIDLLSKQTLKPGQAPHFKRTRTGGTDFEPIIEFLKNKKDNKKYDLAVVITDGFADKVYNDSKVKIIWLIVPEGDAEAKAIGLGPGDKVIHMGS